ARYSLDTAASSPSRKKGASLFLTTMLVLMEAPYFYLTKVFSTATALRRSFPTRRTLGEELSTFLPAAMFLLEAKPSSLTTRRKFMEELSTSVTTAMFLSEAKPFSLTTRR
ncbi:unnamed protein product, partial [Ascophyllum nodosum]